MLCMRIGIDARMYGPSVGGGGLGRYVEQLVTELQKIDRENHYILFLKKENANACTLTAPNFRKHVADVHWYTLAEQARMPGFIAKERLDLMHFPHWNVPLRCPVPFVVTIHDLILLEEPNSNRSTTLPPPLYRLKHAAYRKVLRHAVEKSRAVIAVSQYTKQSILKYFPDVPEGKVHVIYEGVTPLRKQSESKTTRGNAPLPPAIRDPYFLYVGNAYPHKNLEALLHAFSFFHKLHPNIQLVLAGRHDFFYDRLAQELDEIDIPNDRVVFVGSPSDEELDALYKGASLYLFPSRLEGFGLPPLEAMSHGVPVAASNRSSIPEILGDAAVYFSPDDIEEMVRIMEKALIDEELRSQLVEKGRERVQRYSWSAMASEIKQLYKHIAING